MVHVVRVSSFREQRSIEDGGLEACDCLVCSTSSRRAARFISVVEVSLACSDVTFFSFSAVHGFKCSKESF